MEKKMTELTNEQVVNEFNLLEKEMEDEMTVTDRRHAILRRQKELFAQLRANVKRRPTTQEHKELIDNLVGAVAIGQYDHLPKATLESYRLQATEAKAELLRRLGAAVSASPQPRCPTCKAEMQPESFAIGIDPETTDHFEVFCNGTERHYFRVPYLWSVADFAQFFAPAPAQDSLDKQEEDFGNAVAAAFKAAQEPPKKCTCPATQYTGSEPNDSTCELTEEEHQKRAAQPVENSSRCECVHEPIEHDYRGCGRTGCACKKFKAEPISGGASTPDCPLAGEDGNAFRREVAEAGNAAKQLWPKVGGSSTGEQSPRPIHKTVPIQVWADVDEGIAPLVKYLNTIPGVRTHASCQGTIGEGGVEPYGPQVMVSYQTHEAEMRVRQEFDCTDIAQSTVYVRPRAERPSGPSAPKVEPIIAEMHQMANDVEAAFGSDLSRPTQATDTASAPQGKIGAVMDAQQRLVRDFGKYYAEMPYSGATKEALFHDWLYIRLTEMYAAAPSVAGTPPTLVNPVVAYKNRFGVTAPDCTFGCDESQYDQRCNIHRPGAAQGTPQVEEIAREVLNGIRGVDCATDAEQNYVRHVLRRYGVGAPAQPGPLCQKCGTELKALPTVHCPKCASTNFLTVPAQGTPEPPNSLKNALGWALEYLKKFVYMTEDGASFIRNTNTELAGFAHKFHEAEHALAGPQNGQGWDWLTARIHEGMGAIEFGPTENGDLGIFRSGEEKPWATGDDAEDVLLRAMEKYPNGKPYDATGDAPTEKK